MLRKYGGNAVPIIVGYKRKLHELFQGENLVYLIATLAVILAAGCFKIVCNDGRDEFD